MVKVRPSFDHMHPIAVPPWMEFCQLQEALDLVGSDQTGTRFFVNIVSRQKVFQGHPCISIQVRITDYRVGHSNVCINLFPLLRLLMLIILDNFSSTMKVNSSPSKAILQVVESTQLKETVTLHLIQRQGLLEEFFTLFRFFHMFKVQGLTVFEGSFILCLQLTLFYRLQLQKTLLKMHSTLHKPLHLPNYLRYPILLQILFLVPLNPLWFFHLPSLLPRHRYSILTHTNTVSYLFRFQPNLIIFGYLKMCRILLKLYQKLPHKYFGRSTVEY